MPSTYSWGEYRFTVYDRETRDWPAIGGVYVFAKPIPDVPEAIFLPHTEWEAVYVGKTRSFRQRFLDHEEWGKAVDCGFTYVHILPIDDAELRASIEAHLIKEYHPQLNDLGK